MIVELINVERLVERELARGNQHTDSRYTDGYEVRPHFSPGRFLARIPPVETLGL
jgi:hypothetical protein